MKNTGGFFLVVGVLLALLFSGMTLSAEYIHERKLQIAIDDGTGDGQFFIDMDDGDALDLDDLQLGETRSVVDNNGRPILITRTENGIELNVDGKQIALPDVTQAVDANWVAGVADVEVDVAHAVRVERFGSERGVTIISGKEIDEATRSGIRSLLSSAGYSSDVNFVDGESMAIRIDGAQGAMQQDVHRHVKVISKEVSATN